MKTIEEILLKADEECEDANCHDRVGMAFKIFESIKHLVPKKQHLTLAEYIASVITTNI